MYGAKAPLCWQVGPGHTTETGPGASVKMTVVHTQTTCHILDTSEMSLQLQPPAASLFHRPLDVVNITQLGTLQPTCESL